MTTTVRDWVSPVDWDTPDYDWNGNPQAGVGVHFRPVSATVTKLPAEFTATVTLVASSSATVTKLGAMRATVTVVDP